jgi:AhpD family alkylhydroperoxidase
MSQFPDNYKWITENFAEVMKAHQKLGKKLQEAGPLDNKTAELVKLAAAAASRSEGAVHSHIKRAVKAGASPEEIYHTLLLLLSTVGFPTIAAALSWARDYIENG